MKPSLVIIICIGIGAYALYCIVNSLSGAASNTSANLANAVTEIVTAPLTWITAIFGDLFGTSSDENSSDGSDLDYFFNPDNY